MGERRSITYPGGKKVCYFYDDQMRLGKMRMEKSGNQYEYKEISYAYDTVGRIAEKRFLEGMRTLWHYDDRGQLSELLHEDGRGILDRYLYEYDLMGNKTAVTKERRGLWEESGRYEYGYDALSRLVSVSKDGKLLRDYAYDAFGNRSSMADYVRGRNASYIYDALNRLESTEEWQPEHMPAGEGSRMEDGIQREKLLRTDYIYDDRGNLIREEAGGKLIHGYEYGAMNRLARAWDGKGQEAVYRYNGLGQRTGRTVNGRDEDYLLDLTKPYHNLLGTSTEGKEQSFYFDWNVTAMEEKREGITDTGRRAYAGLHYYMQDEPGEGQPFGYTGYRYDGVGGTYFAQAREYQMRNGRFTAEDVIKGDVSAPEMLNQYSYCWSRPMMWVDKDGNMPSIIPYDAEDIFEYVGDSYERYNRQRKESPAPVMPEDATDLPDYTEVIDEWLFAKEQMFQEKRSKAKLLGMIGVNVMGKKESWDTGRQIKLAIFAVLALMCEIGVILLWLVRWLDNNTYWNTIKISNKEEMFQFVVEHQEELEQVVWEMENQYGESEIVILRKNNRELWNFDYVSKLFKNFSAMGISIDHISQEEVVDITFAYVPKGYTYWGIYYSKEGEPDKWGEGELIEQEGTYVHMGSYFRYETEKIIDNWYYYQCKTW